MQDVQLTTKAKCFIAADTIFRQYANLRSVE